MKLVRTVGLVALPLALAFTLPASASAEPCELHVWAQAFKPNPEATAKSNLFVKVTPYTGDPRSVTWLMEPFGRISEVDDATLIGAVQLPADTRVIRHREVDSKAAKKSKVRLIPGAGECYADLFFELPVYWPGRTQSNGRDVLVGKFIYRRFGLASAPLFEAKVGGGAALTGSYEDKSLTDARARDIARQASADLVEAFAKALERKIAEKKK